MELDSYIDAGVLAAIELVNELPEVDAGPRSAAAAAALPVLAQVLAIDPPSVAQLRAADAPRFAELARCLREVFDDLSQRDVDAAAGRLNALLAAHPAHPYLGKEADGQWRLHHHPVEARLVPMWTSICAEGLARMIGAGHAQRFGRCGSTDCGRMFFDVSKNASRRFCSITCQNRAKTAAFRQRRSAKSG